MKRFVVLMLWYVMASFNPGNVRHPVRVVDGPYNTLKECRIQAYFWGLGAYGSGVSYFCRDLQ